LPATGPPTFRWGPPPACRPLTPENTGFAGCETINQCAAQLASPPRDTRGRNPGAAEWFIPPPVPAPPLGNSVPACSPGPLARAPELFLSLFSWKIVTCLRNPLGLPPGGVIFTTPLGADALLDHPSRGQITCPGAGSLGHFKILAWSHFGKKLGGGRPLFRRPLPRGL